MWRVLGAGAAIHLMTGAVQAQEIPRYDVTAYCRQVSSISGGSAVIYKGCMEMEQSAYNKQKAYWPSLSRKTRSYCDEVARVSGGSYTILDGCIDMEVDAAGSAPSFKY